MVSGVIFDAWRCLHTLQVRQQQRENIRLKLLLSEEDDSIFGCENAASIPSEMMATRSSNASLRMCFMNEDVDDDDDDDDGEPAAGPFGSPDIIAGMRKAHQQNDSSCDTVAHPLSEYGQMCLDQKTYVCSNYTAILRDKLI